MYKKINIIYIYNKWKEIVIVIIRRKIEEKQNQTNSLAVGFLIYKCTCISNLGWQLEILMTALVCIQGTCLLLSFWQKFLFRFTWILLESEGHIFSMDVGFKQTFWHGAKSIRKLCGAWGGHISLCPEWESF